MSGQTLERARTLGLRVRFPQEAYWYARVVCVWWWLCQWVPYIVLICYRSPAKSEEFVVTRVECDMLSLDSPGSACAVEWMERSERCFTRVLTRHYDLTRYWRPRGNRYTPQINWCAVCFVLMGETRAALWGIPIFNSDAFLRGSFVRCVMGPLSMKTTWRWMVMAELYGSLLLLVWNARECVRIKSSTRKICQLMIKTVHQTCKPAAP